MFNRLKKLKSAFGPSLTKRRVAPVMTRLARDERGVIIIMFALLLPIMIGFIGMGVEVAYWFQDRRDLQAAADAGALAGAYEVAEDRVSSAEAVAQREAEANGWSSSNGDTILVNNDQINSTFPSSGNFDDDSNAVEVILTRTLQPLFIGYFMDNLTLTAGAVATVVAGATEACVLALGNGLSPGASAITVNGGVDVVFDGCTLATNSENSKAIKVSGTIQADCAYIQGGGALQEVGGGTLTTTKCSGTKAGQPEVADPYADIAEPSFADCGSNNGTAADSPLSADVYCKITVSGGDDLVMTEGTYFIDQGDFKVTGGTVTATDAAGVTIVFGDSSGGNNCGIVNVTGGELDMTAPPDEADTYTGILFFRHSSCSSSGGDFSFTGNSDSTLIGAMYNPGAGINFSGGTSVSGACLQLIGNQVTFSGDGTIGNDCDGTGVSGIEAGGKGSLVE